MVNLNSIRKSGKFLLAAAVLTSTSACSLRSWWGEKPKEPESIQAPQSGNGCPEASRILDAATDEESSAAYECLAANLSDAWNQVEGERRLELSDAEIATLIRKEVLKISGDRDKALKRILTAKKLLGFGATVSKQQLDEWIAWARLYRPEIRRLYQRFTDKSSRTRYADIHSAAQLAASALQKIDLRMEPEEMAQSMVTLLDIQDRDFRLASSPAAELGVNLLNMLCPTFSEKDVWDFKATASCLQLGAEHFRPGAAWIEFMLNPVDDMSPQQVMAIKKSITALTIQVKSWFEQPSLSPLETARIIELSRRMGAKPPENLIESLRVIRNFKGQSTEETIYPEAIRYFFDITVQAQLPILDGMPLFVDAVRSGNCREPDTKYWTDCVLKDYGRASKESAAIDLALRVKSTRHGITAAPLDGRTFSRIMILHALSGKIIDVFDDIDNGSRDYLISTDLDDEQDELVQLITIGVTAGETVSRFIDNFSRKLRHLKVPDESSLNLSRWDVKGFARLVTMTNEILVRRTPEEHNVLEKVVANLVNLFPGSNKLFLDQLALTAVLATVDALPQYRHAYLHPEGFRAEFASREPEMPKSAHANAYQIELVPEPETEDFLVERASLIKNLPKILKDQFPRTYAACNKFGFDRSCGMTFDELLPAAPAGSRFIHANDLDLLTIVAVSMEGVIDSCDSDGDAKLSVDLFDGNDELDCGFHRVKDVVQRLIESRILNVKAADARRAKFLLNAVNSVFLTRIAGKVALVRGTTKNLVLNYPLFLFYRTATMGSMYGLVADIANPDRAREIADGMELIPREEAER